MSRDSLFTRLSTYASSDRVRPLENFSTELLAWLINASEPAGVAVAQVLLGDRTREVESVQARTQVSVPSGFVDLWLSMAGPGSHHLDLLVENKIGATIGQRPGQDSDQDGVRTQLAVYLEHARHQQRETRVVLLATSPTGFTPEKDLGFWEGERSWISVDRALMGSSAAYDQQLAPLFDQAHRFFVDNDMALEKVNPILLDGTRERRKMGALLEHAARLVADQIPEVESTAVNGDKWGLFADWKDERGGIGGLVYADRGDVAVYLKDHRYGRDPAWRVLASDSRLSGLMPRRSGKFWDYPYVPIDLFEDSFFLLDAGEQALRMAEASLPIVQTIRELSAQYDF